jgi:hypothetical protein
MIISDLNYLESATQDVVGGTSRLDNFRFKKDIDSNIKSNIDFKSNSNVRDFFEKKANIDVKSNVQGNSSSLAFDNEAIGKDSNTQGTFSQLTVAGQGSSQSGTFVSAAN